MAETAVTSFVVRFMQEDPADDTWRGFIHHVQTNQEIHFSHIEDALGFMGQFIKIDASLTASKPQTGIEEETP
jgi:hypothetical protein